MCKWYNGKWTCKREQNIGKLLLQNWALNLLEFLRRKKDLSIKELKIWFLESVDEGENDLKLNTHRKKISEKIKCNKQKKELNLVLK